MVVQVPSDSLAGHLLASICVSKLILLLACEKCILFAIEIFFYLHAIPLFTDTVTSLWFSEILKYVLLSFPHQTTSLFSPLQSQLSG